MAVKEAPLGKQRVLTVGYQFYESRHRDRECRYRPRRVPFLRLSGDWLHAAGFAVGQKARVRVIDESIVIVPED